MQPRALVRVSVAMLIVIGISVAAGPSDPDPSDPGVQLAGVTSPVAVAPAKGLNEQRILGVLPNYGTVNHPTNLTPALTAKQKWNLALRDTIDPFNLVNAAFAAGLSHMDNDTPKYGHGGTAYAQRYGAAVADFASQNFFSAGVLACLLHQDPRYFRMGPEHSVVRRIGYSATRIVIARQDSGAQAFNASGIFGMMLGIVASNAYYPAESVSADVMLGRVQTSLTGGLISNLTSEFWPDLQLWMQHRRFLRKFAN